MMIVDSQIHLWENARMTPHHRQIPTYAVHDLLQEMATAGVDAAVIHPPSSLGEAVNLQAVDAVRRYPDKFCILGHFDLQSPDRLDIVKNWRQRPGMLGFRFTFNQPHQQSWWSDGSLTGSGQFASGKSCLSACWPAATWPNSAASPNAIPVSNCISTIMAAAAGAGRELMTPPLPILARCWRSPNTPMSPSSFPARRAIRASPTPIATSTTTF